jgi:hypothetical protein
MLPELSQPTPGLSSWEPAGLEATLERGDSGKTLGNWQGMYETDLWAQDSGSEVDPRLHAYLNLRKAGTRHSGSRHSIRSPVYPKTPERLPCLVEGPGCR